MSSDHDKMCAICWEEITDPSVTLKCGHRFHYKCLTEWAKRSEACPMCREEFVSSRTQDSDAEDTTDMSMWAYYEYDGAPQGYQLLAQGLIALSSSITFIRFLALFFPSFVQRLFRTQVEAGKHLQVYFRKARQWLHPYLSTICLAIIIFSTPYARNFL